MTGTKPQWLAGKTALVVGEGAAAQAVVAALRDAGARVETEAPATLDADAIASRFDAAGAVDLLVHAGTALPVTAAHDVSPETWRETFSADIDGRFHFAAEFARRCIADRRGGNILLLMPPVRNDPGYALAASEWGALDNLVKSLAAEWGRDGIRINGIASRTVDDFASRSAAEKDALANLAAYLLSDYAAYMTGMISGIDEIA